MQNSDGRVNRNLTLDFKFYFPILMISSISHSVHTTKKPWDCSFDILFLTAGGTARIDLVNCIFLGYCFSCLLNSERTPVSTHMLLHALHYCWGSNASRHMVSSVWVCTCYLSMTKNWSTFIKLQFIFEFGWSPGSSPISADFVNSSAFLYLLYLINTTEFLLNIASAL